MTPDAAPPADRGGLGFPPPSPHLEELNRLRTEFTRFMLTYRFAVEEMTTKIGILREEFLHLHAYNPIEHVGSRVKTPESLIAKVARKGIDPSFDAIRAEVTDIAGVRVTCSFTSDVYRVFDMLSGQADLTVRRVRDYVLEPKPSGYRSLHAVVEVPVFLSSSVVQVPVELQLRTIAMDFWATLEHKIFYKYRGDAPAEVAGALRQAAETAHRLDVLMEGLHDRLHRADARPATDEVVVPTDDVLEHLRMIRARRP
ncbi:GTP pyrophosphokinase family protein [Actinotalea sp. Marseille-Q4924]|uniref:GTP pyrophosphokinase n=1 Tax=Actinotalea sp. Marseille-Q4924 TaxID=2866571 RepID=UPI00351D93BC